MLLCSPYKKLYNIKANQMSQKEQILTKRKLLMALEQTGYYFFFNEVLVNDTN